MFQILFLLSFLGKAQSMLLSPFHQTQRSFSSELLKLQLAFRVLVCSFLSPFFFRRTSFFPAFFWGRDLGGGPSLIPGILGMEMDRGTRASCPPISFITTCSDDAEDRYLDSLEGVEGWGLAWVGVDDGWRVGLGWVGVDGWVGYLQKYRHRVGLWFW